MDNSIDCVASKEPKFKKKSDNTSKSPRSSGYSSYCSHHPVLDDSAAKDSGCPAVLSSTSVSASLKQKAESRKSNYSVAGILDMSYSTDGNSILYLVLLNLCTCFFHLNACYKSIYHKTSGIIINVKSCLLDVSCDEAIKILPHMKSPALVAGAIAGIDHVDEQDGMTVE